MELTAETKYQLLLEISLKIRDTLDLDEILNHLLDMVRSVLDYDAAGIFVLNQDLVHSGHDRPQELIASVVWRGFDSRPPGTDPMLSQGKGIVGYVIKSGESVVIPDVRLDARYVAGRQGTRSEIAVPIIRNERATGALNLESDKLGAYGGNDVEVLRFFADAAAISIEKAMLHRQILENERIADQLKVAHEVQSRLLPDESPDLRGYDIAGTCISTYLIGGDYFDYIRRTDDKLGIVVADVSGKGVPAALIMAAFRALLRSHARSESGSAHIARTLNRLLPDFTGQVDFVTAVYGVLDPMDGCFTYTNCGHHPPLLFRAGGRTEKLKINGPGLSVLEEVGYDAGQARLAPGDLLLLYTDGVVELLNRKGDEFGVERLEQVVRRCQGLAASVVIRAVVQETRQFSGSARYQDDFTLVIIRRELPPE